MSVTRWFSYLLLVVLLLAPAAPVPAADGAAAYQRVRADYLQLRNSAKKQLYRDNWQKVIGGLLAYCDAYPDSDKAPDALYLAGKAARGLYEVSRVAADARQAVSYFDRLAERYPNDNLVDDGLIQAGELLEDPLQDPGQAYRRYSQVVLEYPDADGFGRAQVKVKQLASYAPKTPVSSVKAAKGPADLSDVRYWTNAGYTRVVLDFSRPVHFSSNQLPAEPEQQAPPRVYVDVDNVGQVPPDKEAIDVGSGGLRQIRTGRPSPDTLRVVLDLDKVGDYKVFSLEDPFRIVIDVANELPDSDSPAVAEVRAPPPAGDGISSILNNAPAEKQLQVQIPDRSPGGRLRKVVVDAGHGGKDPGAIGPNGVMEKDVTLAIARVVARRLHQELGCKVIMTRDSDVFLPLQERTDIGNKVDADLFISIHANASTNRRAYGIETYYLNFSKNDQAVAVAARENGTTLKEVGDLELILFDLMANSKINESSRLAAEIQNSLVTELSPRYSAIKDLGVRPGPFHVLLGATMPSVLVETAFISNHREEKRLTSSRYQRRAADAIIDGVRSYAKAFKLLATN